MPQNPTMVKEKDGEPVYMWSVDAAEALRLGDYVPVAPDEEISSEQRASAMSRFKTGQATTHPELQTPEEKEATRAAANEEAELLAGLPPGTPIVVQAPSDRPAQRSLRESASRSSSTPPPSTPPASSSTGSASTPAAHPPSEPPVNPDAVRPRR